MGKGNWLTSKGMKKKLGFLAFVLLLVWDMVKLIEVSFSTEKEEGVSGAYKQQNQESYCSEI